MTDDELRLLLYRECLKAKGQSKWARKHGLRRQTINSIISGKEKVWPAVARALG